MSFKNIPLPRNGEEEFKRPKFRSDDYFCKEELEAVIAAIGALNLAQFRAASKNTEGCSSEHSESLNPSLN